MSAFDYWDQRRQRIRSRKGGWRIGQGVSCAGYSLLDDLLGNAGFFQVLMLNVTGTLPDARLTRWLEAAFICLSFPDPRIWCNQVAALAGSARCSPVAGISAGLMASDSSIYGPGCTIAALRFIAHLKRNLECGAALQDLVDKRLYTRLGLQAPGYSRPVAHGDARVDRMEALLVELGYEQGPHLQIAWQLDAALRARSGDSLNLLGHLAAFWLDRGFDAQQGEVLFSLCVNGGLHACYEEARSNPAGSFLPLRCDDVAYRGRAERSLPDAVN